MIGVAVAAGLALGVEWRRLVILALGLAMPLPALVAIGLHSWRRRSVPSTRAPAFCDAIASELRAGASFRSALATAADSVGAIQLAGQTLAGADPVDIARSARSEFPEIGDELTAVLTRSEGLGVRPATLFDEMGTLALAQADVAHEVAVASAPAKAATTVLLGLPSLALVVALSRGGLGSLFTQPSQRAAAVLGICLVMAGLGCVALILRRAR